MKIVGAEQLKVRREFMLIIIIILSAIAVAIFLLSVEVPISFVDKSDWETYHNNKYGYEFKYPKNKELEINEDKKEACVYDFCVQVSTSPNLDPLDVCANNILVGWNIATLCIKDAVLNPEYIYFKKNNFTFGIFFHLGPSSKINRDILSTFKFIK